MTDGPLYPLYPRPPVTPLLDSLTEREEEVILLIADGFGLREIGERLGISWWTARDYRDQAREKLGATTQAHAVAIVLRARAAHPVI